MTTPKRIVLIVMLDAVAAGLCFVFLRAHPLVADSADFEIHSVVDNRDGAYKNITSTVDKEKLAAILKKYSYSGVPFTFDSYSLNDVRFELDCLSGGKPLHLVLGKKSFAYGFGKRAYIIRNSSTLLAEIDILVKDPS